MIKEKSNTPKTMEELLASLSNTTLNLTRGQTVTGEVVAITGSEIILDLGVKSEGVIPVRDFPEGKLPSIGDKVMAFVIEPENESSQVVLSLQQAQARPNSLQRGPRDFRFEGKSAEDFSKIMEKFKADETYIGTVVKVTQFGVFVALEEGVEGLIHSSKVSTNYEIGQKITVMVDSIEPEKRRISLSPVITSTKDLIYK